MVDEDFQYIFSKHGLPETTQPMSAAEVDALKGQIPDRLIAVMAEYGRSRLRRGLMSVIHPDDFQAVLDGVLGTDADLGGGKARPFLLTAFGTVYFWHPRYGCGDVDFVHGRVLCVGLTDPAESDEFLENGTYVPFMLSDSVYDEMTEDGKGLFKGALRKLGPLNHMEVYAFVPALAFGGAPELDNLHRREAGAHLNILSEAVGFDLCRVDERGNVLAVRQIT